MGILNSLLRGVTWWNGQTLNTQLFTWRKGIKVGEDAEGNVYYRNADSSKRWVIFNGEIEATRVNADWHGWLHQTFAEPPTEKPFPKKPWELPHSPNMTGTSRAYHPDGSLATAASRPHATGDYDAWSPE